MPVDGKRPRLLIVEDELLVASTLEMVLSDRGYGIMGPAATVEDAIALLHDGDPDLALLDYRLGSTTTEPLLTLLEERKVPFCMLTGYGRDALPERYRKVPVIEKPFGLADLLREVERLCAARE